jgi:glycogen debranching enzyme
VTPRRGKAVEINALWYNALCLMCDWAAQLGDRRSAEYRARAERVWKSFNERFWHEEGRYLFDVVDGEDGSSDPRFRPNQILAVSLPNPVLARDRWKPVVQAVRQRLLTPVGLRSLAPEDADFKARYFGDLRTRDAAYHQGTVWGWLLGPFVDAWLKVNPDDDPLAQQVVQDFVSHLNDACLGSVSEVFDAQPPYTARGCIAQAWSVAELLRVWVRLEQRAANSKRREQPATGELAEAGAERS